MCARKAGETVSRERFITEWEAAAKAGLGASTVAEKLGLKVDTVLTKASTFRTKHGIPLSNLPKGGGAKVDPQAAMELLAKLRGQSVDEVKAQGAKMVAQAEERAAAKASAAAAETASA